MQDFYFLTDPAQFMGQCALELADPKPLLIRRARATGAGAYGTPF